MNKFTKELVDDYAEKLLIGLTEEENKLVLDEFDVIEANMNKINNIIGLSEIEPMTHPFPIEFELREDIESVSDPVELLLQNCEKKEGREVEVPKVVES